MAEAKRQLVVVVEGMAALGPYWPTILTDYVEKIARSFCTSEGSGKKLAGEPPELALVVFHTQGPYNALRVQRSGWTKDIYAFLSWLSGISFSGGGFNEVPICEGLAEALMILQGSPNTTQDNQNHEAQKHCILVAASNPYPSRTPAYYLPNQCIDQKENTESSKAGHSVADAETIARSFAQCSVSLSVMSPRQLPALKAIYNAGKRNPQDANPPVDDAKNLDFLVLLSEDFMVARTALSCPLHGNEAPNLTIMKMDSAPAVTRPGPTSIANPSGGTTTIGLPNLGATLLQGQISNTGVNSLGVTNNSAMNMSIEQHPNAQQPPPKYVKIWEGALYGLRHGQRVQICKLEAYRRGTAAETLAADWPKTLEIVRLIAREHMKYYGRRTEFLVFRALNQHGFLGQLKEKDLCAVIQLPSQTLLLSTSDKVGRLLGLLLPRDMVAWKPPVSDHQPTMQQHQAQLKQLQEQQHQLQLQQQLQGLVLQQQQRQMPLPVPSNNSSSRPSR